MIRYKYDGTQITQITQIIFLDADLADDADSYVFSTQNHYPKKLAAKSASSASKKFAGFA